MKGIHISSDNFEPKINKIEPNKIYNIKNRRIINTKYGTKSILVDEDNKSYWFPACMYKIFVRYPDIKEFTLTTGNMTTYKGNNGEYEAPSFMIDA